MTVCGKVVGVRQKDLTELYERRVIDKGRAIANDETHVLNYNFELLPSGHRYRAMLCKSNRTRLSFVSKSIQFLNKMSSPDSYNKTFIVINIFTVILHEYVMMHKNIVI